jgi:hypothetical protein
MKKFTLLITAYGTGDGTVFRLAFPDFIIVPLSGR